MFKARLYQKAGFFVYLRTLQMLINRLMSARTPAYPGFFYRILFYIDFFYNFVTWIHSI